MSATGRYLDADGNVLNLVSILGSGATPISEQVHALEQYAPHSGLILGEDGKAYSLVDVIANYKAQLQAENEGYTDGKIDALTGADIALADAGGHYTTKTAEAALQQVGSQLAAKATKAASPTVGHIATLDSGGNPTDSGHALSEYASAPGLAAVAGDVADIPSYTFDGFTVATTTVPGETGGDTALQENAGYVQNSNGQITGTASTWRYSQFIPISRINGVCGDFFAHVSVAAVSYYSAANFSTWLGKIASTDYEKLTYVNTVGTVSQSTILDNAPEGAQYVVFSTDGASRSLYANLTSTPDETSITVSPRSPMNYGKILHMSFDDTIYAFQDLTTNASTYTTIFDSPFFGALKTMHDTYGAVFSCYCYYNEYTDETKGTLVFSLADCTTDFAEDFAANADWLRFGFHTIDLYTNYAAASAETALGDYETTINRLIAITGSIDCIDTCVRLHNYSGSAEVCVALRDAVCGVTGLLSGEQSDILSQGYYFSSALDAIASIVGIKGRYFDAETQLFFFPTNTRLDNYIAYDPNAANYVETYLDSLITAQRKNRNHVMIMFAHQNQMFNSSSGLSTDYVNRFTICCAWAVENGYSFAFPMDKIDVSL